MGLFECPDRGEKIEEKASFSRPNSSQRDMYFERASYVSPKEWHESLQGSFKVDSSSGSESEGEDPKQQQQQKEKEKKVQKQPASPQAKATPKKKVEKGKDDTTTASAKTTEKALRTEIEDKLVLSDSDDSSSNSNDDEKVVSKPKDPVGTEDGVLSPSDRDELQRTVDAFALWNRWCTLPKKQFVQKLEKTKNCPVTADDAEQLPWNFNKTMINVMAMGKLNKKAAKNGIKVNVGYA